MNEWGSAVIGAGVVIGVGLIIALVIEFIQQRRWPK